VCLSSSGRTALARLNSASKRLQEGADVGPGRKGAGESSEFGAPGKGNEGSSVETLADSGRGESARATQ